MNLEALLAARDGEEPSGENLEYDYDFMQLQIAAQPGEERQAGAEILAAEEPDYKDVEAKALAILERSHDLRAAVILASAVLNTKGIKGFAEVIAYVRGCLDQYWDTCHPQLDADDDNDPTMRINALQGLSDRASVMAAPTAVTVGLRRAPLTNSRNFGRLTLRDLQMVSGEVQPPEGQDVPYDRATVAAAFTDTGEEAVAELLATVKAMQGDLKAIEAAFADKTPGYGPDLDDLRKMLGQIARYVGEHAAPGDAPEAEEDDDSGDAGGASSGGGAMSSGGPAPRRGGGGLPGAIETAQDARAALDKIMEYFRRYEPSSPVPIILERAKRLVGADFLTIMKDMAPGGLDSVMMIGGINPDEDDD